MENLTNTESIGALQIKSIALRLLSINIIFMLLMTAFRAVFLLYYGRGLNFDGLGWDIVKTFYMGGRFDLAVISDINILVSLSFIILLFVGKPAWFKKFFTAVRWYYTLIFGLVLVFLCIDFGFYSYFQNHINILIYGLFEDDTAALLSTLNENYNLFLTAIGFLALFAIVNLLAKTVLKMRSQTTPPPPKSLSIISKITISILLIFFNFACSRGSFGTFPLEVDRADVSSNAFLNKAAINGFYTLQAAIDARNRENRGIDYVQMAGYQDIRQAFADFLNKDISQIPLANLQDSLKVKLPFDKNIDSVQPNVIIIIMESFGSDLFKYNSPSFDIMGELKEHFDADLVFYNFLPAHRGTIASLESAIINIAIRPLSANLSQSQYAYRKYDFAGPQPYKIKGYETIFMYGGGIGWRNVGSFMPNLGFDKMIGEGGMDGGYQRNQWGVYDGDLFDFVFKTLESTAKKKFICIMTTTNHPPYSLPKNYESPKFAPPKELADKILDKELAFKRFEAFRYSADAAGKFIAKIKNSKYADNTIIAIAGDHNFYGLFQYNDDELFGSLAVPFYIYIPQKLKPAKIDTTVFGSHLDIMPTIYSLSLSDIEYKAMGTNLLSKQAQNNMAFNDEGFLANKDGLVQYDFANKKSQFFTWGARKDFRAIKAVVQSQQNSAHQTLLKRFLSQTAIADYLIKNLSK